MVKPHLDSIRRWEHSEYLQQRPQDWSYEVIMNNPVTANSSVRQDMLKLTFSLLPPFLLPSIFFSFHSSSFLSCCIPFICFSCGCLSFLLRAIFPFLIFSFKFMSQAWSLTKTFFFGTKTPKSIKPKCENRRKMNFTWMKGMKYQN